MGAPEAAIALVGAGVVLYAIVYYAVRNAIRDASPRTVDEVVVRLMAFGWRPPAGEGLPPEAREIMAEDARQER